MGIRYKIERAVALFLLRREYRKYRDDWDDSWVNYWERRLYNWIRERGFFNVQDD